MYRQDGGERLLLRLFTSITKRDHGKSEVASKVPAKRQAQNVHPRPSAQAANDENRETIPRPSAQAALGFYFEDMRFVGPKLKKNPDNPHPFSDVHINYSIGNRQRKKH